MCQFGIRLCNGPVRADFRPPCFPAQIEFVSGHPGATEDSVIALPFSLFPGREELLQQV